MKLRLLVTALILCFFCGFTACVFGGCQSQSAQAAAYHTLRATALAGQAAIDAAAHERAAGRMSQQRWQLVAQYYDNNFQPALRAAITLAAGDTLSPPPPSLLGDLARLQALAANK